MNKASNSNALSKQKSKIRSWSLKSLLEDSAKEWDVSQGVILTICAVPFIVVLFAISIAPINKELYKWFTREDGFAESMQVLFYLLAFIFCIIIIRHLWNSGLKGIAALYLFVSFGLFFLIGEELNWGQRIFGWETPESYASINKQKETNLHNIYGVGHMFKWVQLLVGAYGTILPLMVLSSKTLRRYRETISWLVPHYSLIPFFIMYFVWRIYRNFFEAPKKYYFAISEYNEVMELLFSMGMALFMIFQHRRFKAT